MELQRLKSLPSELTRFSLARPGFLPQDHLFIEATIVYRKKLFEANFQLFISQNYLTLVLSSCALNHLAKSKLTEIESDTRKFELLTIRLILIILKSHRFYHQGRPTVDPLQWTFCVDPPLTFLS